MICSLREEKIVDIYFSENISAINFTGQTLWENLPVLEILRKQITEGVLETQVLCSMNDKFWQDLVVILHSAPTCI